MIVSMDNGRQINIKTSNEAQRKSMMNQSQASSADTNNLESSRFGRDEERRGHTSS